MKSVLGKYAGFAATAALAAACGSVWAQSIPVPASSADSGRRAVVAVTQPNMSNYATKNELTAVDNRVTYVWNEAAAAKGTANAANANAQPWAKHFVGTWGQSGTSGNRYYIDGNGLVYYYNGSFNAVGYTYLSQTLYCVCAQYEEVIGPTGADANGRPTGWGVLSSQYIQHQGGI